jgi:NAD(P)-dependent dehydrogenase (short-subunit alcohol dehydrogenase family)
MVQRRVVLISGCSSGIGAALAEEFHRLGHIVYATARHPESLGGMANRGMRTLPLDVTDAASIAAAFDVVQREQGRLDLLVNNAGYALFGPVSDLSAEAMRRQLETNVIAPVQMIRAALRLMLPLRSGCIVNVGSVSGILTTPFAGAYCASKAALHALSEAMRMELAPFGIHTMTVQPGRIASHFGEAGIANLELPADSIYSPIASAVRARAMASQKGAISAATMARKTAAAALRPDPPAILRAGPESIRMPTLRRWMPIAVLERKLAKMFGLNALAEKQVFVPAKN